jgi:hypothetical protein
MMVLCEAKYRVRSAQHITIGELLLKYAPYGCVTIAAHKSTHRSISRVSMVDACTF